jgi:hypothetical protein
MWDIRGAGGVGRQVFSFSESGRSAIFDERQLPTYSVEKLQKINKGKFLLDLIITNDPI